VTKSDHAMQVLAKIVRGVFVAALSLGSLSAGPAIAGAAAGAQAGAGTLVFEAPAQVAVGEVFALNLRVEQASDLAGYEAAILFDTSVAEYAGLQQRQNDVKRFGRDVSPLTVVDLPNGAAVGLFSCPVNDCVTGEGPRVGHGANGNVNLATVFLVANAPGLLEVKLDGVKFVDGAGNPVAVEVLQPAVTIQVGAHGEGPAYAAPAGMWGLASAAAAGDAPAPGPFDLTEDGQVTNADAMEVALEWELLRQQQAACGALPDPTRDVNHDGCIDVADMQLVAAHYGPVAVVDLPVQAYLPLVLSAPGEAQLEATATTLTFVVNSTGDQTDSNIGNGVCRTAGGVCTLRAAIQEANRHIGADTINFNIPGSGVQNILLNSKLPTLTDGGTTINGYSQPGSAPNTAALADNAVIKIQIQGGGSSNFDGLSITSANNTIRGLALYNLQRPFWIYGTGASNNVVVGCFVGTNAAGTYGSPTLALYAHGFHVEQGAHGNYIGRANLADRNVISGNARSGVGLWHERTDNNVVMNNIVGLNPAGTGKIPNRKHGLDINFGAAYNTYGGTAQYQHNVSSGNDDSGQELSHTTGTTQNKVIGNYYGTDLTGNNSPSWAGNLGRGIMIEDGATGNQVTDNVIGGNGRAGLEVYDSHTFGNVVARNRIGISLNGNPIPNAVGMWIKGNGLDVGPGNIIAYNTNVGIKVEGDDADNNTITRNSIFGNGGLGIDLFPRGVNLNNQYPHTGPNQALNFPVLNSATPTLVTGTACAGCTVEVFIADSGAGAYGEGKTFVGSATASGTGAFSVSVSGVTTGKYVTATATDAAGNTSEFCLNRAVTSS
jgi:CSLREA domain-containing protein